MLPMKSFYDVSGLQGTLLVIFRNPELYHLIEFILKIKLHDND